MRLPEKLPGPWRITFDTNPSLCNLHCIMCDTHSIYNKKGIERREVMPIELVEKVIGSAHEHLEEVIPSTMGEPLLYPHFREFLNILEKYGIRMNLTTNGTFPILGVEKWGELILPLASDVKISINGASREIAESIMVGIDFEKQLSDIKKFIGIRDRIRSSGDNHPTVTFQVTYMEKNLEELPKILELAIDLGVDRLKGHHLWITWPELENESLRKNKESIERWNSMVDTLYDIKKERGSDIKLDNVYQLPTEGDSQIPDEWICPFLGREAWIAWDGTFNVCCAPDNLRRRFGHFGNVRDTDFMELWNSEKYNRLVSNWGDNEVCNRCNMRRPAEEVHGVGKC